MVVKERPDWGAFPEIRQEIQSRLSAVFEKMDAEWDAVARANGFQCNGCEDNCCETRFHHHTISEWFLLYEGMNGLPQDTRKKISGRAKDWVADMEAADADGVPFRKMCPANENGRCQIYDHRPMICRLHGLAWKMEIRGQIQEAPGCGLFEGRALLDRTPLYMEMAEVEGFARQKTGFTEKIRLTIAEMVVAMEEASK